MEHHFKNFNYKTFPLFKEFVSYLNHFKCSHLKWHPGYDLSYAIVSMYYIQYKALHNMHMLYHASSTRWTNAISTNQWTSSLHSFWFYKTWGLSLPTLSSFNTAHLEKLIVDQLVRKSTFHWTLYIHHIKKTLLSKKKPIHAPIYLLKHHFHVILTPMSRYLMWSLPLMFPEWNELRISFICCRFCIPFLTGPHSFFKMNSTNHEAAQCAFTSIILLLSLSTTVRVDLQDRSHTEYLSQYRKPGGPWFHVAP